tara:strand:- start:1445 stop:2689 length:1245 start_codon:yes stop_codon:yes gene_type:complete
MKNRIEITADEFCSSVRDGTHDSPKEVLKGGKPLVTTKHLRNGFIDISSTYNISNEDFEKVNLRSKVDKWDVLISMIGTVGEVFLVSDEPDYAIKNLGLFKIGDELNSKWLFYYLKSQLGQNQIKLSLQGSTQQYISLKSLRNLLIYVPETEEETKSIVSFLSLLDKKIELNHKKNETLEKISKTLFKSWFIDFDPVRAKAEGRPTGLSKEMNALFPDSFEDSEIGKIPKGWKSGNLGDLFEPSRGKIITKAKTNPGIVPVVAGGIKPPYYHSESNVKGPVITISASGTAGYVNLYYQDIWASDCSYVNKDTFKKIFFAHSFLKINQERIYDLRHGAVQQHVYPKDLVELPIVISPDSIINTYEDIASQLHKKIETNLNESETLVDLRDTLLPKLISGELKMPDAQNLLEEADI